MSTKNNVSLINVNLAGLLLTAFIVLKLCGVVNWSWWWVLTPAWIPIAFIFVIFVIFVIGSTIMNEGAKVSTSSTSRKQDRAMKKLRKRMKKGELDTEKFIRMADTLLRKHKSTTEPTNPFLLLDIKAPDSTEKSIRRHKEKVKKNKFSLSRWWKEGCVGLTLFQKIKKWWVEGNKKSKRKKQKNS